MKVWFFCKGFFMLLVSVVTNFLLYMLSEIIYVQFDLNSFFNFGYSVSLIIDKQSMMFVSTVTMVSSMIFIYSYYYLVGSESEISMKKFLLILMLFVLSMILLSLSSNLFWMMVGWDGLGISSFCLIIFYQNWKSFSSGMVTFMCNRMGDVFIIFSMLWCSMNQSLNSWMLEDLFFVSLLFGVGSFSKSAQFPYLFWLPQAMAAPTPVSALVHSSTLVTAGIFSICRFYSMMDGMVSVLLFLISCVTILIAGSSSLFEFDLKKLIALSTLCHVSLMMMFSLMGEMMVSLFHFMMHAYFKSLLFMIAGYLIHQNLNSQDLRYICESSKNLIVSLPFFITSFSMMGFPFLSGFYSKELMLFSISSNFYSFLTVLVFMLNSMFSCAYSIRIANNIFYFSSKKLYFFEFNSNYFVFFVGSVYGVVLGGLSSFFLLGLEEEVVVCPYYSWFLLVFSFVGVLLGFMVDYLSGVKNQMLFFLMNMWYSNFLYKVYQKHFFLSSAVLMWMVDEKGYFKKIQFGILSGLNEFSMNVNKLFFIKPMNLLKVFHLFLFMLLFFGL